MSSTDNRDLRSSHETLTIWWSVLGVLILGFQVYAMLRWVTGPHFVPTDPGPDPISPTTQFWIPILQTVVPIATLICFWYWLIRPWMREGKMTADGRMLLACGGLFFWDAAMNYTSTTVLYNSHYFNRGSWYGPSFPGWNAPNGNLLPEPLLFVPTAYVCLIFTQVIFVCWLLRKAKARWPQLGVPAMVGLIILVMTIVDSIIEILCLRTEVLAYPGGIREVTLWAGQTYQFPLTEGLLFGGLGIGSLTVLRFFRNDRGETFVEKDIDKLPIPQFGRQWMRFLAIYGFAHGMFIMLWVVPNQWLGLKSDPFPEGLPSYLINDMCKYGDNRDQCPGPGISIPRPIENPF